MGTYTTRYSLYKPDILENVDLGQINSNSDQIDAALGLIECTSTTRPASPGDGQLIYETNTASLSYWNGFAWVEPIRGFIRYTTKALMDANTTAVAGAHANVYADSTATNNGDYIRAGSAWISLASAPLAVAVTGANSVDWSGMKVERVGSRVFLSGSVTRSTDITGNLLGGTLALRPVIGALIAGVALTSGFTPSFCPVLINPDGTVMLNAPIGVANAPRQVGINGSFGLI